MPLPVDAANPGRQSAGIPAASLAACGLLAVALLLRLHDLAAQSLWWDEVSSWQQARLPLPQLLAATAADNYPPLHNLLLHLTMALLGEGEFALRLPSALLGGLSVLALYWTGSLLVGRGAALLAALLLCVSGFHLWYSQEARMYALLGLAAIAYAGTALQSARCGGWRWGLGSVVAGACLLYSHPFGALDWGTLTLSVGIWRWSALRSPRRALQFLLLQALALLLYAPWALILVGRARAIATEGFWLPPVTPQNLVGYFETLLDGPGLLAALLLAIALAALPPMLPQRARLLARLDDAEPPPVADRAALGLLLAWGLLPAGLGVAISLLSQPVLYPRYLIGSLPALLLLLGFGFSRLPRNALGALALLGLGAAMMIGFFEFSPSPRDDFRDIAAALATEWRPGDCVAMNPQSQIAMRYYRPAGFGCVAISATPATADFFAAPQRVFVILTEADQAAMAAAGQREPGTGRWFGDTRLLLLSPQ